MPDDAKPVPNQLNTVVRDLEKTLAFYRRLGIDISERTLPGASRHAEVRLASGFLSRVRERRDRWHLHRFADLTGAGYKGKQPP